LKQTRPYVSGSTLWGALSARIARDYLAGDYEQAQQWVNHSLKFTYLYPSTNPGKITLWPWGADSQEFAWLYLSSYVSTALHDGRSGLEGSLHETEHISPVARSGEPVYLIGYLWKKSAENSLWSSDEQLRDFLTRVQLGGERTYGWGRIRQVHLRRLSGKSAEVFDNWRAEVRDGQVYLSAKSRNCCLLAHSAAGAADSRVAVEPGALEPLLVRRITRSQPGHGLQFLNICWAPGTLTGPIARRYVISDLGFWDPIPERSTGETETSA
jgi:hypothetical protein